MHEYVECKIVAEVGAVHLGSLKSAIDHIDQAKLCGADYVKFQKRHPPLCVPNHIKEKPHPNPDFAYGDTYLDHRWALELSIDDHINLNAHCKSIGIKYAVSVWDSVSAKEIIDHIDPDYIKIPSACNTNFELLEMLYLTYSGCVHISLGMTYENESKEILDYIKDHADRTVVYHCTSEYPCEFERLYLLEIPKLATIIPSGNVGFSNHGKGIAIDMAAYTLGARWLERHFAIDRTIRHSDAAASLEPAGLTKLCRDLKNVRLSLQEKPGMSKEELSQRNKLKKL